MRYLRLKPHRTLFEHGQMGFTYYVILKGKVGLFTPHTLEKHFTYKDLYEYVFTERRNIFMKDSVNLASPTFKIISELVLKSPKKFDVSCLPQLY